MNVLDKALRRGRAWAFRKLGAKVDDETQVQDRLVAEPWFIDAIAVSHDKLSIDGWSFPRADGKPTTFMANDVVFDHVGYPLPREDVGKVFWQRRGAGDSGFHCATAASSNLYPDGVLKLSRTSDANALGSGRDHWFVPDPTMHTNLPDADRRFRVIGNRDPTGFLNTGATDFFRLNHVAQQQGGEALWARRRVLDWGVGCGRLARHFPRRASQHLTGCDIDHDNVAWCAANLAGTFVNSSMHPPLPFADASFDLIYGISIFTHLKEPLQFKWLQELQRVTAKGGLVLTTVHGATAIDFFRLAPADYQSLQREVRSKGILVASSNAQLDGHVDHAGEYVNVFHSADYVRNVWSQYFDVLAIVPGYIFTHDLVVLKRRS